MLEINNLTTNLIDEDFLRKVAKMVLDGEPKKDINISLAFVGQGRMRKINKKYRKKNRATDVLSFPDLNEIMICLREVKKNAQRNNLPYEKELAKVLIHGILHLLGYEHEKNLAKAEEMEKKENYYLSKIF